MKYVKCLWVYWLPKQYIRCADWLNLNKTIATGLKNIPSDKPLIFAPNHQNALSDPMDVLLNTRFQPVWLARADIFGKAKATNSVFRYCKMAPLYRLRDGKENPEKNDDTFSVSVKVLENDQSLGKFDEAAHSGRRQMLTHNEAVPYTMMFS